MGFLLARLGQPSTLTAAKKLMREKPMPCLLRSTAKLGTLEIQTVLPKRSRGAPEVLVWGWPTPIRMNARTELPPLPREARLWPCRSRRGSADPAGGEARGDQLRLVHQDESLPRDQGGAAAELLTVGGGASLYEARPQGAEARAGCAGTASASPGRSRSGPRGRLAARITRTEPGTPASRTRSSAARSSRWSGLQPVAFRA